MQCVTCQGRGFTELENGLIMVECEACNGTGRVEHSAHIEDGDNLSQPGNGDDLSEPSSRTERVDKSLGSPDTSQPKQPKKPRAKKRGGKRVN